jgi:hypothetical protein
MPYLTEGTAEDLRQFYKKVPDDIYKEITEADPFTFQKDGVKQVGKPTRQLLHVLNKSKDLADTYPGASALFDLISSGAKLPKPLETYNSLKEFMADTKQHGDIAKKAKINKENPVVFKSDKFNIRQINSREAAVYFGCDRDSGWCTARHDGSYYESTYSKKHGQLWIIAYGAPDAENPDPKKLHSQLFIDNNNDRTEWKWSTAYARANGIDGTEPPVDKANDGLDEETHGWVAKVMKKALGQVYEFQGRTSKYKIDPDGTVVFSSVDLSDMGLTSLKEFADGISALTEMVENVKQKFNSFKSYLRLA